MVSAKSKKATVTKKSVNKTIPKKAGKAKVKAKTVVVKKSGKATLAKKKSELKSSNTKSKKPTAKKILNKSKSVKVKPVKKEIVKKDVSAKSAKSVKITSGSKTASPIKNKGGDLKKKDTVVTAKKTKTSISPIENKKVKKGNIPLAIEKKTKPDKNAPDPLQIKAEKAIKELEETMDLSKLRPRISTGTSAPKPLPKVPVPPIKLPEPQNTLKEKFQIEFEFRSSPKILFTSLSDSSGLAGWFADEVHTKDDIFTFVWEGGESVAKQVAIRDLHLVRFQWLDDTDGTYFQFEIKEDDITSDIALVITDFAAKGEKETNIRLWESQVQKLRMLLGSL